MRTRFIGPKHRWVCWMMWDLACNWPWSVHWSLTLFIVVTCQELTNDLGWTYHQQKDRPEAKQTPKHCWVGEFSPHTGLWGRDLLYSHIHLKGIGLFKTEQIMAQHSTSQELHKVTAIGWILQIVENVLYLYKIPTEIYIFCSYWKLDSKMRKQTRKLYCI